MNSISRIKLSLILLLLTILVGVFGYHIVEGMSYFDSLYMTIITISTVGFHEVKDLSVAGRVITIIIISTGITIGAYTIGTILRMLIEGEFRKTFGRRKVEKTIQKIKDHYIICGYGRIGGLICMELQEHNKKVVVIENQPDAIVALETDKVVYLAADATQDESLINAGIMNARAIVTAVKSDADNVYIALTAKGLRSAVYVLSRASDEKNELKLIRAGAARVVSPYHIGGKRMAQVLIRPTVVDFIDSAIMGGELGLLMEELMVQPGSSLIGKNLIESNLRNEYGVIIVLIKKADGAMKFNPLPTEILEENDVLVMLGKKADMDRMAEDT